MLFPKGQDPKRLLEEQAAFEEAERQKAEARARAIFDSLIDFIPVAIEIFGTDGNLLKSNKAAERLLGKIPPPGVSLFEERGLKRTGLLEPQIKRLLAGARVETPPTWYDPADIGLATAPGKKVCFRATALPLLDAEGTVKMIAVVYEDLTELKKAEEALNELKTRTIVLPEETSGVNTGGVATTDARDIEFARRKLEQALRESEERYRALVDSSPDVCIIRLSDEGRILNISSSIANILGISREAVLTDNSLLFANVHPEDLSRLKETEAIARQHGEYPPGFRFRVIKKPAGEIVWVELRGKVCNFASRRTLELIIFDITPWKNLEERLRKKETDISSLLNSPADGVLAIDKEWVITFWSGGAETQTRIAATEAKGHRLWDVYPEMEKSGMAELFRGTLLDRQPRHGEVFYSDGREKYAGWFAISTYPFDSGVLALIQNITGRKKIEAAWRDIDTRLNTILNNQLVLVAFKDRELRYVMANAVARKIFNQDRELAGKTDAELFPATVTALLGSYDRQILERGDPARLELALGDPKQENTTWLALWKQPWRNQAGEILGIMDIGFDITHRVRAQQELTRRREYLEKMVQDAEKELQRWSK